MVKKFLMCGLLAVMMTTPLAAGSIKSDVVGPYVEVRVPGGTGSGVVIERDGEILILTAAHVAECLETRDAEGVVTLKPATLIRYVDGKKDERPADLVRRGSTGGIDLALLRPRSTKGLTPAHFCPDVQLEIGEDCWYVGTTAGVHARLERSIISILDVDFSPEKKGRHFGTNGCVWKGNSGGGVYVKRPSRSVERERTLPVTLSRSEEDAYYLVGIVVCGGPDSQRTTRPIGYCVDLKTITKFLSGYKPEKKGGSCSCSP